MTILPRWNIAVFRFTECLYSSTGIINFLLFHSTPECRVVYEKKTISQFRREKKENMSSEGGELNDGQIVLETPDRDRDPPAPALTQLKAGRHGPGVDGNATGGGDDPVAVSTVLNNF